MLQMEAPALGSRVFFIFYAVQGSVGHAYQFIGPAIDLGIKRNPDTGIHLYRDAIVEREGLGDGIGYARQNDVQGFYFLESVDDQNEFVAAEARKKLILSQDAG